MPGRRQGSVLSVNWALVRKWLPSLLFVMHGCVEAGVKDLVHMTVVVIRWTVVQHIGFSGCLVRFGLLEEMPSRVTFIGLL